MDGNGRNKILIGCFACIVLAVAGGAALCGWLVSSEQPLNREAQPNASVPAPPAVSAPPVASAPAEPSKPTPDPTFETLEVTDARDPRSRALLVENRVVVNVFTREQDDKMLWAIADHYAKRYSSVEQLDIEFFNRKIFMDPNEFGVYRFEDGKRVSDAAFEQALFAEYMRRSGSTKPHGELSRNGRDVPRP